VIPSTAQESLDGVALTAESLVCDGALARDPRWFRFVLIDRGDPAVVRLVLQYASL
jgi:hypothetical protein